MHIFRFNIIYIDFVKRAYPMYLTGERLRKSMIFRNGE